MSKYHGFTDQQWQALHEEIQQRFRAVGEDIKAVFPAVELKSGKTVTKLFPLFSYLYFKRDKDDDGDLVTIGIDVAPKDGGWEIIADIAGDESGTVYFELPNPTFVVSSFEDLRDCVLRTTDDLVSGGKPVILRLLSEPAPVLEDRRARRNTKNM